MRVLVIGDGSGRPPELEPDVVPDALASLPSVEVVRVQLVADDDTTPDDPAQPVRRLTSRAVVELDADVWVTGAVGVLLRLGRTARQRGVRVVHRARRVAGDATPEPERLLSALGLADAVVVPTDEAAAWLAAALGPAAPPCVVVPPWLAEADRAVSDGSQRLVVGVGPLGGERRPMRILRSFTRASASLPDWRLRLLGGGPQRQQLTLQAGRDGVRDRFSVSGPGPRLGEEWAQASVAVLAARTDPFPIDGLAAMTAGVPVVAYDVPGGLRALVSPGVNGLLVPSNSLPGLASALVRLGTDDALRAELGAGARRTALAHAAARRDALDAWAAVLRGDGAVTPAPAAPAGAPVARPVDLPVPPPTPQQARTSAVRLVTAAAARTGTDWFVLPGETPTVVLGEDARADLLAALAHESGDGAAYGPSYLSVRVPAQLGWPEQRHALGALGAVGADVVRGLPVSLVVEPWPTGADGTASLVGQGCGVEVQLWPVDVDGTLVPPGPHGVLGVVRRPVATAPREVAGVSVPVPPVVARPTVHEVRVDVDVVYTWVDGDDARWAAEREARLAASTGAAAARTASGRARFQSRDELRYSLRSVHLFAPWVRRIHLVTAGQVPAWLDTTDDRVRVVDHREILPPDALPTFNSHAIETRLHHVPDLAEHFVYLNDDVMLGRPLWPRTFFDPGGRPAVFGPRQPIGDPGPDSPEYLLAAANNRRLLADAFGVAVTSTLAHTPHPHRVSVLREVEERFAEDVSRTTRSPFRSATDVSMLSSLAQHYGLLVGAAHEAEPSLAFVGLAAGDLPRQLTAAARRDQDFLCLGDHHDYVLPRERVEELVAAFLESYFPVPAPWERPGS